MECLQNAVKYADASRVEIALARSDGRVRFEVRDDGAGFDLASRSGGTGLQGIGDRMEALGGTLEMRSAPGAGTQIIGSIPAAVQTVVPVSVDAAVPAVAGLAV
jgi:signal transduction histidine kinase